MRFAVAIGLAGLCLLACTDGVLDVGSNDASVALEVAPAPTAFSAAAVQRAQSFCSKPAIAQMGNNGPEDELRSTLAGAWAFCTSVPASAAEGSFQFTVDGPVDGHWFALVDDGEGGLRRATSSDAVSEVGNQGTYSLGQYAGVTPGSGYYVATSPNMDATSLNKTWFWPAFSFNDAGALFLDMYIQGSSKVAENVCVRIEP